MNNLRKIHKHFNRSLDNLLQKIPSARPLQATYLHTIHLGDQCNVSCMMTSLHHIFLLERRERKFKLLQAVGALFLLYYKTFIRVLLFDTRFGIGSFISDCRRAKFDCYSCMSLYYKNIWDKLIDQYWPPLNFTNACANPAGFNPTVSTIPCAGVCITIIEPTYGGGNVQEYLAMKMSLRRFSMFRGFYSSSLHEKLHFSDTPLRFQGKLDEIQWTQ